MTHKLELCSEEYVKYRMGNAILNKLIQEGALKIETELIPDNQGQMSRKIVYKFNSALPIDKTISILLPDSIFREASE